MTGRSRLDLRRYRVQGHRGARGLAPENTVPSFRAAIEAGATGIELDVRLTGDGQVVVWHDPTLQAEKCLMTGVDYTDARVDELTLAQLRTVDVGSRTLAAFPQQRAHPGARIPTLAEVFDACSSHDLWWTVEVKVDPEDPVEVESRPRLVDGVLLAIHEAGLAQRSLVHSFDWGVLDRARELDPGLLRSALAVVGHTYAPGSPWVRSVRWEDHGWDLASAAAAVGAHVVSPHHLTCDAEFVDRAHALGLAVVPWTVNEEPDLVRVVEAGVDALVTDYPARAVPLLEG
ncbi:MAG: glycerophosphodiester phosphodiesterase family protein [Dermatophilaceae bacterium]